MTNNQEDVEEIEDIVGHVTYTDSQKSIPTTLASPRVYSSEFTDSSEDRNNSSGKETYVVECDSEDSEETFHLSHPHSASVALDYHKKTVALNVSVQCATANIMTRATATNLQRCSFLSQETFTQTSKTIIELAEKEGMVKTPHNNSLQTQTSYMSITENKSVEYRIEVSGTRSILTKSEIIADRQEVPNVNNVNSDNTPPPPPHSLDESSSKFPVSVSVSEENVYNNENRSACSSDQVIRIISDDSDETILTGDGHDRRDGPNTLDIDNFSLPSSNIEEDSLKSNSPRNRCVNVSPHEIKELRERLAESDNVYGNEFDDIDVPDIRRIGGTLTPLTEESNIRQKSSVELTLPETIVNANYNNSAELIFTAGLKVKMMKNGENKKEPFKLPPINSENQSCPNSPQLLHLLFNKSNNLNKSGTLPCLFEKNKDRWEIGSKNLASGESPNICESRNGKGNKPYLN